MKIKRKKVHRDWLENQLYKYERRIQKLAEAAYHVRQAIEILDAQEAARNQSKGVNVNPEVVEAAVQTKIEEKENAICGNPTSEGLGSESDIAGEDRGSVRPSVHSDATEVASEPQLDNVESDSPRGA